jgi:hypothetical protein
MSKIIRHFDAGSIVIIGLTLALFLIALFLKGLTHDLLLEGGVFLVSVKLILLSYKNSVSAEHIESKLEEIQQAVRRIRTSDPP